MVVPLILASYDIQDSRSISSSISSVDSSPSTSSSSSSSSSSASSSEQVDLTNYHEVTYSHVFIQDEFSGTWNKEHMWPCSQMKLDIKDPRPDSDTKNHATNLHNLRVSCQDEN